MKLRAYSDPAGELGPTRPSGARARVVGLPLDRSDEELVVGLRADRPWAKALLFDRYSGAVERIARRLVGGDRDIDVADVVHDAFVAALEGIDGLRDATALEAWMRTLAARTAFRAIRRKRYRRWLCFWEPARVQLKSATVLDGELVEAHRRTCALLARLPDGERVPFALRFLEGMELGEIAAACDLSLATVKRRIGRAEKRFVRAAKNDPLLCVWLEEGGRWT